MRAGINLTVRTALSRNGFLLLPDSAKQSARRVFHHIQDVFKSLISPQNRDQEPPPHLGKICRYTASATPAYSGVQEGTPA